MSQEEESRVIENPDLMHISPPPGALNGVNNGITDKEQLPVIHIVNPMSFFRKDSKGRKTSKVVVLLNQKINIQAEFFLEVWRNSTIKICGDGGANQLYDYCQENNIDHNDMLPEFIIGDLDSIREDVKLFYKAKGIPVKAQYSQYFTDLDKVISLITLRIHLPNLNLSDYDDYDEVSTAEEKILKNASREYDLLQKVKVFLVGSIGGRFDQTISTLSQLIKCDSSRPNLQFYMINNEYREFVLLLRKGMNFFTLSRDFSFYESAEDCCPEFFNNNTTFKRKLTTVGLLPLLGAVKLNTIGLKWDVKNWDSAIGGNVSSSNLLVGDNGFYVECSGPIFVNIGID